MNRYRVTGIDCSADGMERLRMQSEFILIACPNGDSSPADIVAEWESDLNACCCGDGFDFDAARAAITEWAANNGDSIDRELSYCRSAAARGDLNWNDESADEFDSVYFRLYIDDTESS